MFKANALDPDLAAVDASFRNIGYASGFAFDRWKTGINCMLLKKTNNYLVNKLRTILLLEADSGMNYKKLCRDVMWFAELAGAIPPELGGGRRKHRPIEQVLCSVLLNDLLRQNTKLRPSLPLTLKGASTELCMQSPSSASDDLACLVPQFNQ